MHCDDKRMLWVLEQEIISCWESLKKARFQDKALLDDLNESIIDYNDYKKTLGQASVGTFN